MTRREFDGSLHLVINANAVSVRMEDAVEEAVAGGVGVVRLRSREDRKLQLASSAKRIQQIIRNHGSLLIINNFVDVAREIGADGVHLNSRGPLPSVARRHLGERAVIGLAVESTDQAVRLEREPVDYLGVSSIYPPTANEPTRLWGESGLASLRQKTDHYLVAGGGISEQNIVKVIAAGADGVAVSSEIYDAFYPRETAERMRANIESAKNTKSAV